MIKHVEVLCDLNSNPVKATPIPGSESLHAIPSKCVGCKATQISDEPRAFEVNQSSVFICKPVDGMYLDEQLAIAVVFNYPPEVIQRLAELVYLHEVRRSIDMFSDYFEPLTITHLRETGVYPYPKQRGEESVEAAMHRHENFHRSPNEETIPDRLRRHLAPKPPSLPDMT